MSRTDDETKTFASLLHFVKLPSKEGYLAWPCIKIDSMTQLQRIYCDNEVTSRTNTSLDYMKFLLTTTGQNHNPPVCLLLGKQTPGGTRLVFNFTTTDHKPEQECTLFPFAYQWIIEFLPIMTHYVAFRPALEIATKLLTTKLDDVTSLVLGFDDLSNPDEAQTQENTDEQESPPSETSEKRLTENAADDKNETAESIEMVSSDSTMADEETTYKEVPNSPDSSLESVTCRLYSSDSNGLVSPMAKEEVDSIGTKEMISNFSDSKHKADDVPKLKTSKGSKSDSPSDVQRLSSERFKITLTATPNSNTNRSKSKFVEKSSFTIPSFDEIRGILSSAGYTISTPSSSNPFKQRGTRDTFWLPGRNPSNSLNAVEGKEYFTSIKDFREYLCAYGVDINRESLDESAAELLEQWVKSSVIKSVLLFNTSHLEASFLSPRQALDYLKLLGFFYNFKLNGWALPGTDITTAVNGVDIFCEDRDLFVHLSRFGIPENVSTENLTAEQLLSLEVYISGNTHMDVFEKKFQNVEKSSPSGRSSRSLRSSSSRKERQTVEVVQYATSKTVTPLRKQSTSPSELQFRSLKI